MRKLARFDDKSMAETLCEVLQAEDIASVLRPGPEDSQLVWIVADPDLPRARELLAEFVADPEAKRYEAARIASESKRTHTAAASPPDGDRARVHSRRVSLRERAQQSPVTFGLLFVSAAVALVSQFGDRVEVTRLLTIASFEQVDGYLRWDNQSDLMRGQLWRLFTPIVLHFGWVHLLFNAFWLNDLAVPTERYQGSWRFLGFILFSAAVSNMAQLIFGHSPLFGGLSGIVYALVGYLWARGRSDPASGIHLPTQWVVFFMLWLALGFTGLLSDLLGHMANFCHLGGFAAGALYGYIAGLIATGRVRP